MALTKLGSLPPNLEDKALVDYLRKLQTAVEELQKRKTTQTWVVERGVGSDFIIDQNTMSINSQHGRAQMDADSYFLAEYPGPVGSRLRRAEIYGANPTANIRSLTISLLLSNDERLLSTNSALAPNAAATSTTASELWYRDFQLATPGFQRPQGRRIFLQFDGAAGAGTSSYVYLIRWTYTQEIDAGAS